MRLGRLAPDAGGLNTQEFVRPYSRTGARPATSGSWHSPGVDLLRVGAAERTAEPQEPLPQGSDVSKNSDMSARVLVLVPVACVSVYAYEIVNEVPGVHRCPCVCIAFNLRVLCVYPS